MGRILSQSLLILMRSFGLVYPPLLFALLLSLLLGQVAGTTSQVSPYLAWSLLGLALFLLYCAYQAGWCTMVALTSHRWLSSPLMGAKPLAEPAKAADGSTGPVVRPMLVEPFFTTFQGFVSGVGRFFGPMILGHVVQLVALLGVAVGVFCWIQSQGGVPLVVRELYHQLQASPQDSATVMDSLEKLSPVQLQTLSEFMGWLVMGLVGYGVFYWLTMFWQPLVIAGVAPGGLLTPGAVRSEASSAAGRPMGVFRAYWTSLSLLWRDPLAMILMGLMLLAVHMLPLLLFEGAAAVLGGWIATLVQFISLIFETWLLVVLFVYGYHRLGLVPPLLSDDKPAKSADSNNTLDRTA
jgi:hypothetical protein